MILIVVKITNEKNDWKVLNKSYMDQFIKLSAESRCQSADSGAMPVTGQERRRKMNSFGLRSVGM